MSTNAFVTDAPISSAYPRLFGHGYNTHPLEIEAEAVEQRFMLTSTSSKDT